MEKRHGLGRGLGALLGEQAKSKDERFRDLAIEKIDPNPQQPRRVFHADSLAELEDSIRELGVLVPIIVRAKGERFELIAGERRLRASKAAGLRFIPALVRDVDDQTSLELAVVENLQREDLDPIEEAMGFADLMRDYGFTQERLSTRLGKSRPAVANALRLLDLPDEIKSLVHRKELTAGHARALLSIPKEERLLLAKRAMREGLTVRDLERVAKKKSMPTVTAEIVGKGAADPEREAVEERLRMHYGAQVTISGDRRGTIQIAFANNEDLIRLVDIMLPPG
jgi:ParB family chromosome partitioning protein